MMLVASDTGPIWHLREAQRLHVLAEVGEVRVPSAVDAELERLEPGWSYARSEWLLVEPLVAPHDAEYTFHF